MKKPVLAFVFLATVAVDASAVTVTFGPSWSYANGGRPAIAVGTESNPLQVEVHHGNAPALWTSYIGKQQVQYTTGFFPQIAADHFYNNFVELHQGQSGPGSLWYSIGSVSNGNNPIWNVKTSFDNGAYPSVAIHATPTQRGFTLPVNAAVLEAHQGQAGVGSLWISEGTPTNANGTWTGISWAGGAQYNSAGLAPSVAMTFASQTQTGYNTGSYQYSIVEVHGSADYCSNGVCALYYNSGILTVSYPSLSWSIQFVNQGIYGFGANPSVTICDAYLDINTSNPGYGAIEVHEGANGAMIADAGVFNPVSGALTWQQSFQYASGYHPRVSCSGVNGVEVHQGTSATTGPLWTSTLKAGN